MSAAAEAARVEAEAWSGVAETLTDPPLEQAITGVDSSGDLARRGDRWSHRFRSGDLAEVCLFAAGLAIAEAEAWETDDPVIATRAHEDRRFVAADRIVWWAVPWASEHAPEVAETLLELGERLRLAPALVGTEGLVAPGHDTLGPLEHFGVDSVLSGVVISGRAPSPEIYHQAAQRWRQLAVDWPGTAQMWLDLAARAERSERRAAAG